MLYSVLKSPEAAEVRAAEVRAAEVRAAEVRAACVRPYACGLSLV
jgi:hypothetical protein